MLIPNRNGAATLVHCLDAVFASKLTDRFEVIVVDDGSTDGSRDILQRYPVRVIRLTRHGGTSTARNTAARAARGNVRFFIDADCVVRSDTLQRVVEAVRSHGDGTIIGGTYARNPHDPGLFNTFQTLFVHYHETRRPYDPDYLAGHAMAMTSATLDRVGDFREDFLPILEDVEFTHRARNRGVALRMDPAVQVYHRFGFSLRRSLRNAFRKTYWWVVYSTGRGDVGADSGTASHALKINVAAMGTGSGLVAGALIADHPGLFAAAGLVFLANLVFNRHFLGFLFRHAPQGQKLVLPIYYLTFFAVAVGAGTLGGLVEVLRRRFLRADKKRSETRARGALLRWRRRWAATGAASVFLQTLRQFLDRA